MTSTALLLAFGSAVLHALWNVLLKRERDLDSASAGVFAVSLIAAWTGSLLMPGPMFPRFAAVGWGLAAGCFEGLYFVGLARSLEGAPLGWSYAWMRGSALAMVWPCSVLLLGESFRWGSLACVLAVCLGLALLGAAPGRHKSRSALAWALLTGCFITCYSLFYKQSLAAGAQPLALFGLSMTVGLPVQTCLRLRLKGRAAFRLLPERPLLVAAAGLLCTLGFTLYLKALALTGAGAVTTVRNTSVAFAMLFALAIGERPRPAEWAGAAMVTLGAVGLGWF